MKARPIIFNGPMVRAILDGRKTQTRRVVKPQPPMGCHYEINGGRHAALCLVTDAWHLGDYNTRAFMPPTARSRTHLLPCPYGQPGDLLWVREGWAEHHPDGIQEPRFSIPGLAGIPGPPAVQYRVIYRADGDPLRVWHCQGYPYRTTAGPEDDRAAKFPDVCSEMPGWWPSIHMPRWASRLTLCITDVRVERVQDISEDNAQAEGARPAFSFPGWDGVSSQPSYRWGFHELWDSINAKRGHGWDTNPWVWVLTFERIRGNVDDVMANLSENLEVAGRGATL